MATDEHAYLVIDQEVGAHEGLGWVAARLILQHPLTNEAHQVFLALPTQQARRDIAELLSRKADELDARNPVRTRQ